MAGSSSDREYFEELCQDQPETFDRNPSRVGKKNAALAGELLPENQHLVSSPSTEASSQPSVFTSASSSSTPSNINQLVETFKNTRVFFSSRELRSQTNCSRRADALISPRLNPKILIENVALSPEKWSLESDPGSTPTKKFHRRFTRTRKKILPFTAERAFEKQRLPCTSSQAPFEPSDFTLASSPRTRRGINQLDEILKKQDNFLSSRWLTSRANWSRRENALISPRLNPEILKQNVTPSPEKRSVEISAESTPSKKIRKTPEGGSCELETKTGFFRAKLRSSAAKKSFEKSPTDRQIQETKDSCQTNEDSFTLKAVDSEIETPKLKSSQSSPIFLNPHVPSSCHLPRCSYSLNSSPSSPKYLNPLLPSSCHLPGSNPSSIIYIPRRVLNSDTSDEEDGFDRKKSGVSMQNLSTSQSKEKLIPGRSKREEKVIHEIVNDFFQKSRNLLKFRTHSDTPITGRTETPPLKEQSTARNPHRQMQQNRNEPDLQNMHMRSAEDEASMSRNRPGVENEIQPPYIDVCIGQESTSRYQPLITMNSSPDDKIEHSSHLQNRSNPDMHLMHIRSVGGEASMSKYRSGSEDKMQPPYSNLYEGQESTSRYQPMITISSSSEYETETSSNFHISSDLPLFGETSQILCKTNESYSVSRARWLPEYISNGHLLLQFVLREMMLFNGDHEQWRIFAELFHRVSVSPSEAETLHKHLMNYMAVRGYDMWVKNLMETPERTTKNCIMLVNERLTLVVISVLTFTLRFPSGLDFDSLIRNYENFRSAFDAFSLYMQTHDIDGTISEGIGNHLRTLEETVRRFLLRTHMAFRWFLMYIGENADDQIIDLYEEKLADEDKKHLRKKRL